MRDQLPLFKAGIWMLLAIILIVAFFFLVDRPLLSFKNTREEELVRMEQDEQQKEQLKKQEQELITALTKVNREINSLEAGATGLLNRADVTKYIAAKAAEQQVKVSDLKIVGLKNNQGVWNVTYHIALDGICANVLAVVKGLENAGQSRYMPGMSFLQQGPLKSQAQDWLNTPTYFTYELQPQPHVTNYNYAYGSIQVPIVIVDEKNQPASYLRIKGLKYSDNTIRRYDWRLVEAALLVGDKQYGLGYPKVDFDKKELSLDVDIPLSQEMIGQEVKGIYMQWFSFNRRHTVMLALTRPLVITAEMFDKSPDIGAVNRRIANYNQDMLRSIVHVEFNIQFSSKQEPDVYYDYIAGKIQQLKQDIISSGVTVAPDGKSIVIQKNNRVYQISGQELLCDGQSILTLTGTDNGFAIAGNTLRVKLNVLSSRNLTYNLAFVKGGASK